MPLHVRGRHHAGRGIEGTCEERFPAESTLRSQVAQLTDALQTYSTGLKITVDEVPSADREELRKLGEILQLARREGRDLAFPGAGLAQAETDPLNDDVITFLRRSARYDLAEISVDEVARAMAQTIEDAGRGIDEAGLARAAEATHGYPFLMQLVGHRIWQQNPIRPGSRPRTSPPGSPEPRVGSERSYTHLQWLTSPRSTGPICWRCRWTGEDRHAPDRMRPGSKWRIGSQGCIGTASSVMV